MNVQEAVAILNHWRHQRRTDWAADCRVGKTRVFTVAERQADHEFELIAMAEKYERESK